jgi:multicomponent Na+:H+ antiporter subunit D
MTGPALASLLPLPVALPIAGAVAAPLLARLHRRLAVIAGLAALGGATVILLLQAPSVFRGLVRAHYLGLWAPVHGQVLGIALAADPFGLIFALASAVIGAVLLLYTLSELGGLGPRELGGYACLFQLVVAALIGAGCSPAWPGCPRCACPSTMSQRARWPRSWAAPSQAPRSPGLT